MKNISQRIRNLIGQLEAVQKMISADQDCVKVLVQIKAARGSLDALVAKFLVENLAKCSSLRSPQKKKEFEKIVTELAKV
ncbi:MAG: metal-sensitive transcriptional regulator [Candidatus Peribacteraceae bacterium]|nr:metal-sensitive transcriptional regulator [Candidatus Peribacteraceae bacterium]